MNSKHTIFQSILNDSKKSKIIQITGKAGTGKSSIGMSLGKTLISLNNSLCIWIDTEKKFSKSRYNRSRLLNGDIPKNKDLIDRLLLNQPKNLIGQQFSIQNIRKMLKNNQIPRNSILIIDTISNHFRNRPSTENWVKFSENVQSFFDNHIKPLLKCHLEYNCYLIFIHQTTYNPNYGELPFLYRLFKKITSFWIDLNQNDNNNFFDIKFLDIKNDSIENIAHSNYTMDYFGLKITENHEIIRVDV